MFLLFALAATAAPLEQHNLVIDLVDGATLSDLAEVAHSSDLDFAQWLSPETEDEALAIAASRNPEHSLRVLREHRLVEAAEVDGWYQLYGGMATGIDRLESIMSLSSAPNDPDYAKQWHMKALESEWLWSNTKSGKGITVAILDTGVTKTFDMDETRLLQGTSFVPGQSVEDGHGHGTHCAATVAETTGNGKGATGLAKDADILPVKVLSNSGMGQHSWIAAGIDWAVDHDADVISMSLGGGRSEVINKAIDKAIEAGVIVVAAAGNDGCKDCVGWPAAYEPVIAVGATGPDKKRSYYSSYGRGLDVMAPGGNKQIAGGGVFQITRFRGQDSLQEWQGTSMATPHVAGAVAILLAEGAPQTQAQLEQLLIDTADQVPPNQRDEYGRGHINVKNAVLHLRGKSQLTYAIADNSQDWLPHPNPAGRLTYLVTLLSIGTVLLLNRVYGFSRSLLGVAGVTAFLTGGGLFFLTELPFLNNIVTGLAMFVVPWLEYPEYLLGRGSSGFPLWHSFLPVLAIFIPFVPWGRTRGFVVGVLASGLAYLVLNTFIGFNTVWWLGHFGSAIWTGLSALVLGGLTVTAAEFNRVNKDT